ncbi:MAG TPA: MnmC family methyltransferase, partial [Saprospiraceae bacterium]|nr:MnmC family methyltransferase [Saprospiraceae bacterium]
PAIQNELWEQNIFNQISEMTSPGGCIVTYCAQGEVRRRMEKAGYNVNRIPGAPGKRQMIQAFKR